MARCSAARVPILAGTDAPGPYVIAGFGLHDELALLVKAGLTPMQALQAATRNPAEYLGELDMQGTVQPGKIANLILLDADPLKNIKNTTRINAVIQNGRYLSRERIWTRSSPMSKRPQVRSDSFGVTDNTEKKSNRIDKMNRIKEKINRDKKDTGDKIKFHY